MKNQRRILLAAVCALAAVTSAYSQTQATETKDYDNPNEYDQTLAYTPAARNSLPSIRILLNQITRLLEDQRIDLIAEVRNPPANGTFAFTVNGVDISRRFSATARTLDCNGTPGIVYRANAPMGFQAGTAVLTASLDGYADTRSITVYPFTLNTPNRNVILFLGDAMGTAYRDASRIVYKSVLGPGGQPNFVEGFFSDLQQMDKMPISGMAMTYSTDAVVPDSAKHCGVLVDRQ